MKSSKSSRAVFRFVLIMYAVGVGVPLEVDEDVVEDAVVLDGWLLVFVSVVAVVPEAWLVSVFVWSVEVFAVVGAGVVVASPPSPSSSLPSPLPSPLPVPPVPPVPPPAAPPAASVEVVALSVVVPEVLAVGVMVESDPEPLSVVVLAIVESAPAPLSVVVPEPLAVGVIVESDPESLVIVPVTEAVTVDATVVMEIDPTPVCRLAHSTSRVQKLPPQVKLSIPQQSKGTLKVSPVESVSIPGFASTRQVALRKSSLATWVREDASIKTSCPRVKPRSSTAAAARKKWRGIELVSRALDPVNS
jgi:hypothetical protein